MTVLLVGLLTAIPLGAGVLLGYRYVDGRVLAWCGKKTVAAALGIGVATCGLHAHWVWPLGLVTPIVAGNLVALLLSCLFQRTSKRVFTTLDLGSAQRYVGATMGLATGFVFAVGGWQILLVCGRQTSSPISEAGSGQSAGQHASEQQSAWASLAEVAHEGFLKHVPVAGSLTDELLAVAKILDAPPTVRREFAIYKQWDDLAALPSFQAIAHNDALFEEIDAAATGSLVSLYRLQKHPLIVEFYSEESLQTIISSLRASDIAYELTQFQVESTARFPH